MLSGHALTNQWSPRKMGVSVWWILNWLLPQQPWRRETSQVSLWGFIKVWQTDHCLIFLGRSKCIFRKIFMKRLINFGCFQHQQMKLLTGCAKVPENKYIMPLVLPIISVCVSLFCQNRSSAHTCCHPRQHCCWNVSCNTNLGRQSFPWSWRAWKKVTQSWKKALTNSWKCWIG